MTMPVTPANYSSLGLHLLNGLINYTTDTIKVALVLSTYTPNLDTHDFWNDVSANEVAAALGYTAGGATLASKTLTLDAASNETRADAADVSWSPGGITSRYAVVYKSTGTGSTSPLIALWDYGVNTNINSIEWDATQGVFYLKAV